MSSFDNFILNFEDFRFILGGLLALVLISTTRINDNNVFQSRYGKKRFRSDILMGGAIIASFSFLMWWAASINLAENTIQIFIFIFIIYAYKNPTGAKKIISVGSRSTSKALKKGISDSYSTLNKIRKGE